MVNRMILVSIALALVGPAAHAGRWEDPELRARLEGVTSSNLFPGSPHTASDRGVQGELGAATAWRPSGAIKVGLEAWAGGQAWNRLSEASRAWVGTGASLRRGGTQGTFEAEWTPQRVKFPEDPEDGEFSRLEWRAGLRQALPAALRLRLEMRVEQDDFVEAFDARDSRGVTGFARLDASPTAAVRLRVEAERTRDRATSPKFTHGENVAGGGAAWSRGRWSLEGMVRSATRRYDRARPSDSNFRRRDQWIETTLDVARRLGEGLDLHAGLAFRDQSSSRIDRNYSVTGVTFGLRWTGEP